MMNVRRRFLLAASLILSVFVGGAAAEPARITIDAAHPGPRISPTLYGIFFEEINMAGDGGLYAELVRNRSFEDSNKPDHWSAVAVPGAKATLAVDTQEPMSTKNPHSLRLELTSNGTARAGVANGGYFGIAVDKDAGYHLSLSARAGDGFSGPLTVTLEKCDGSKTYAQATTGSLSDKWQTFALDLTAKATDPKARLVITATHSGKVWLDMVSLFPAKTWHDRSNGMRPQLAEMLDGLHPSFVRFPGGCWVEGDTMKTSQRWKTTIGPIADRRTLWNLWGYSSTNGLGFHEYLQLCEDLKAEPLFVINVGMSHHEVVPMEKMGEYVEDALDAIEYANGPVSSRWGAQRAKNGHPAPFGLKYMEIGNENGGPAYYERYPLFYKAIKAKYPQMHLVADVWNGIPKNSPVEIIDEHYYSSPEFFMGQAHRYDGYDRTGPKVYVGEYAVTQGCGKGNLRGALGEAAFMTGMERNSDVVVMASYAPLFANVDIRRWTPDLINFDSSRVYGLPSYYVQQMFSRNRGDVVLPMTIRAVKSTGEPLRGAIGVGTWNTQAEFKDIKVARGDKVLFQSNFAAGGGHHGLPKGWKAMHGKWQLKDGALQQLATGENARVVVGDAGWSDYTLTLKARKLGGAEGFLILFAAGDRNAKNWWNIGGWGNSEHAIEHARISGPRVPGRVETGRWYDIRIELRGGEARCYLDGKLLHQATAGATESLYAVASRADARGEIFVKAVNVSGQPQPAEIELAGLTDIQPQATVIELTSANPDDENTLDNPTKVAPTTKTIDNAAAKFLYTFPPHSVSVLRLQTKR
jgi:alpha-L-arabinofuranosidase